VKKIFHKLDSQKAVFLVLMIVFGVWAFKDLYALLLEVEFFGYFANQLNDFITTFRSIIIQSIPFVFLGSLISVLVAFFISDSLTFKMIPKNKFLSHAFLALLGIFMPVCECGNIPVAKRLILKGLSVSQAFTFMLAAPIINPVTVLSTFEAFKGLYHNDWLVPGLRVISGFVIALTVGLLLSLKRNQYSMLTDRFYKEVCETSQHIQKRSFSRAIYLFQQEFMGVFPSLVLGAMIASALQVFVPRNSLLNLGLGLVFLFVGFVVSYIFFVLNRKKTSLLIVILSVTLGILLTLLVPEDVVLTLESGTLFSTLAMLTLSLVISVCSSVDSFIAIGYTNFSVGSLLSFLTFGPMIDVKLLTILRNSFKFEILWFVSVSVACMSVLLGLIVNLVNF